MIQNNTSSQKPKKNRKQVILRLGKYLLQHKWMLLLAVTLTVISNLLALIGPMRLMRSEVKRARQIFRKYSSTAA